MKFGQIAAVNEFGATDFFDILMSDETGYAANILFGSHEPFSPAGKPGAILKFNLDDIAKGLYIKGGGFTAYRDAYHPDETGLKWGNDFDQGAVGAAEIGYQEPDTNYAGVYKLGMVYNDLSGRYNDLSTNQNVDGNYVAYFTVEKTVFHPTVNGKLETKKGLDLLFQALGAPEDRNQVRFEAMFGARYTGLIPGRDHDKLGLGLVYADASSDYSNASQAAGGNSRDGETALELTYQFEVAPWFLIQPDVQAIFDPQGDTQRSDILVLGLRTVVVF